MIFCVLTVFGGIYTQISHCLVLMIFIEAHLKGPQVWLEIPSENPGGKPRLGFKKLHYMVEERNEES